MSAPIEQKPRRRNRKPLPDTPVAIPRNLNTGIADDNHDYESLGFLAGDALEGEEIAISDLRAGDMIAVYDCTDAEIVGVGRFVSSDAKEFHVCERDAHTYHYKHGEGFWIVYLLTAVTRRTLIERGTTESLERNKRDAEISLCRKRLDKLMSCEDESERFRVLRRIYDLERAPIITDEWSEFIGGDDESEGREVAH
jgi:hypothetical protein